MARVASSRAISFSVMVMPMVSRMRFSPSSRHDATRAITYAIVDGVPVESHEATITVTPTGSGSRVTWVVDAAPDEMADLMQGVYQGSLEALKAHVEG